MTITEIVEREVEKQGTRLMDSTSRRWMSEACARAACLAVANAVVEECRKAAAPSPGERSGGYKQGRQHAADAIGILAFELAAEGPRDPGKAGR